MINKTHVLVFPAGSEIGIEIYHSLKYNLHFTVFGASGKSDHAKFLYPQENYIEGDFYIDKDDFIEKFNNIIKHNDIKFIFPTHDTVTLFLAQHQNEISATILTSPPETALIAREKKRIYELFKNEIFCPITFSDKALIEFPVFIKPNKGQGGKQSYLINSLSQLNATWSDELDYVITEYLPGEELSVDCFTNKHGELLFIGPRTRERVQMGIAFKSKSIDLTNEIVSIANCINEKLSLRGTWFFQLKKDKNGNFKLLEFAVRQASTMGLYRQLGVNFALLSLFDYMGYEVSIIKNNCNVELDRCLYNRYQFNFKYSTVYIDFDDTIIVNDVVNLDAIKYLYYCKNNKIKIVLLTKHKFNLSQTLDHYSLPISLFDEIIHIDINDDKAKYMNPENAIFIDNYFVDRLHVKNKLGMHVFDVDAIDCLIN